MHEQELSRDFLIASVQALGTQPLEMPLALEFKRTARHILAQRHDAADDYVCYRVWVLGFLNPGRLPCYPINCSHFMS